MCLSPRLQVSLALGFLVLTAGVVSLSVRYSTPHKIESFGEGDLFFVDTQAIRFNRGLYLSFAAGVGLSCLGSALLVMGVVVWVFPRTGLKERLFHRLRKAERSDELGSKDVSKGQRGLQDVGDVITKPPDTNRKIPFTLSKVNNVQPSS